MDSRERVSHAFVARVVFSFILSSNVKHADSHFQKLFISPAKELFVMSFLSKRRRLSSACQLSCIDEFQIICKMRLTAIGCWGEDSDLLRLNVSANRFEAGPNPASRFLSPTKSLRRKASLDVIGLFEPLFRPVERATHLFNAR